MDKTKNEVFADVKMLQQFLGQGRREDLLECDATKIYRFNRLFQSITSSDTFEEEFPEELIEPKHRQYIYESLIPGCIYKATKILGSAKIAQKETLPIPELSRVAFLDLIDTLMQPEAITSWTVSKLNPLQKDLMNSLKIRA